MTVHRHVDNAGPATLAIYFAHASHPSPIKTSASLLFNDSSALPGQQLSDRIETIDIKYKHENDILSRLLELTHGVPYEITPEERAELEEVKDYQTDRERDRARQAKLNETKREEQRLLNLARGNTAKVT